MGLGTSAGAMLGAWLGTMILMPIVVRVMRSRGMFDVPNFRSSHDKPVVRGGGVAVCIAATVSLAAFSDPSAIQFFGYAGVLGFALLGLRDDTGDLPAIMRLGLQVPLAIVVALPAANVDPLLILGALFVVAFVNSFNFMDGIDGISGGTGVVSGIAIALMSAQVDSDLLLVLGIVIGAASAGFLPFNVPTARAFLGDSGSYFLGSLIAFSMLIAVEEGVHPVLALSPSFVYAFDTGITLLKRIRDGKRITESHREHIYQRIAVGGRKHGVVALIVQLFSVVVIGLGFWASSGGFGLFVSVLLSAMVLSTYSRLPRMFT